MRQSDTDEMLRIKRAKLETWEQNNKPSSYIKPSLQDQVDAFLAQGGKITVLPSSARSGALDKP